MLQGLRFLGSYKQKKAKTKEHALNEHPCVRFMSNDLKIWAKTAQKMTIKTPKCVMFFKLPRAATVGDIFVNLFFS